MLVLLCLGAVLLGLTNSESDDRLPRLNESSSNKEVEQIELIRPRQDLSIWLDEDEVKYFARIRHLVLHVVANGVVMPYLLDRNMETHLPVIPAEVEDVRFLWVSGERKYNYHFYRLESHDQHLLTHPTINIARRGKIPRGTKKPGAFSVRLPCTGNLTGTASFSIGLEIFSRKRKLAGTPLKLRLRKECVKVGEDPRCDRLCHNQSHCDTAGRCVCRAGWAGRLCSQPVCEPQCMNGGYCSAPGLCECPSGFQGPRCEGGVCSRPCENRGKCVQRNTCHCRPGHYGTHCQFSKCVVPCLNGGHCRGVNKCRCGPGFTGDHCQIILTRETARHHSSSDQMCSLDQCRALKRCRKQNCEFIKKSNKLEMRSCKAAHCGSLLGCRKSSCSHKKRRRRLYVK